MVAIVNPQPMLQGGVGDKVETNKLKVTGEYQMMDLGISADLGRCRSTKASSGQRCQNAVNISQCEYCPFHLSTAARTMASRRGELQGIGTVP